MKSNELLLKAADYIARNGHYKGAFHHGGMSMPPGDLHDFARPSCVLGAMRVVAGREGINWTFASFVRAEKLLCEELGYDDYMREVEGETVAVVPLWNDDPSTTAEDVILTMKRAAHREEK